MPFQNSNDNKGTLILIGFFKVVIHCHIVNSVCIGLIEVSADQGFVRKENIRR